MKPNKAVELIKESDIKKFILGGVALFVLNFLLGLATAKAEKPSITDEAQPSQIQAQ